MVLKKIYFLRTIFPVFEFNWGTKAMLILKNDV